MTSSIVYSSSVGAPTCDRSKYVFATYPNKTKFPVDTVVTYVPKVPSARISFASGTTFESDKNRSKVADKSKRAKYAIRPVSGNSISQLRIKTPASTMPTSTFLSDTNLHNLDPQECIRRSLNPAPKWFCRSHSDILGNYDKALSKNQLTEVKEGEYRNSNTSLDVPVKLISPRSLLQSKPLPLSKKIERNKLGVRSLSFIGKFPDNKTNRKESVVLLDEVSSQKRQGRNMRLTQVCASDDAKTNSMITDSPRTLPRNKRKEEGIVKKYDAKKSTSGINMEAVNQDYTKLRLKRDGKRVPPDNIGIRRYNTSVDTWNRSSKSPWQRSLHPHT